MTDRPRRYPSSNTIRRTGCERVGLLVLANPNRRRRASHPPPTAPLSLCCGEGQSHGQSDASC